ncbi:hypothetical protein MHUMG1_04040 [Metarhizium humberi]|uniref:ABC transporter, transmembrane domain, type 1 n=1 Tax=Metarhizium humberi TaxID=2596975 RepID=A0A9P8MC46_9HYPO|nr:hypothetical protein MHUMG1_04040 [Metarhizium humberi]
MAAGDDSFGPHLPGYFDFTLLFEQSLLSLVPTGIFLLAWPWRIRRLWRRKNIVGSRELRIVKLVLCGCFTALQIVILAIWCLPSTVRASTSIAEAVFGIIAGFSVTGLSYLEHARSVRPSLLLNFYLLITAILDLAKVRTAFLRLGKHTLASLLVAALVIKVMLFVIEEVPKKPIYPEKPVPRESSAGVTTLDVDDIGIIDEKFDSQRLLLQLEEAWDKDSKQGKFSLIKCTFLAFKGQFAAGIAPRILFSGFTFAQPFLINTVVDFVGQPDETRNMASAKSLIAATLLLYVGRAVAGAWYKHTTFQLLTMYRGALISLVFRKTLELDQKSVRESAPVTLMSTDVEGIATGAMTIHDIWASLIELPVALYLLYRHVGVPSLFILIPATAAASQAFTPAVVILAAIFWTKSRQGLSVAAAFTSLSIITIAATPVIQILVSLMQIFGVIGCFARLQVFLKSESRRDPRQWISSRHSTASTNSLALPESLGLSPEKSFMATKDALELVALPSNKTVRRSGPMLRLVDATFSVDDSTEVFDSIDMTIEQGTLSMVVGRVGCGKSCLLKAMAGEVPLKSGTIETRQRSLAYCDQTPWVTNVSVKDNIIAQSEYDQQWLATVLHACQLDVDVSAFPLGVATIVGSGGVALSGGQKQRVAMARAVYSRKTFVILDDVFSGLDNKTSRAVFQRLLGSGGLLRNDSQTVVLATNNVSFLEAADYITMLEKGKIVRNQVQYSAFDQQDWGINQDETESNDSSFEVDGNESSRHTKRREADRAQATRHAEAELSRQTGDIDCYKIYLKSMGLPVVTATLILVIISVAADKTPQIWLRLWTQHGTTSTSANLSYMGGYVGFIVLAMIGGVVNIAFFAIIGIPKSAKRLHAMLLAAVIQAPFHFFTCTDNGLTLNRFSQDMSLLDQALPFAFIATVAAVVQAIAETAIIASGSSYIGAILPVCFVAVYLIQHYYLKTSRQVRILDLEMKSPLYTHFTETLAGLSTIRAFGWTMAAKEENLCRLNTSQRPYYTMFCIQRWLQVILDLFTAGMALVLVTFAVMFPWTTSNGAIGLAMVNIISFEFTLSMVITQWTQLETSLGAITRLKWFIKNTPSENKRQENQEPPPGWPSRGLIELDNVTAAYKDGADPVLLGVSLTIEPGQKVGICGRSGSGKSSLVATLARLLELQPGSTIRIDGVNLATVPRQTIRSRLISLPQDALSLAGTVRHNLDPEQSIQADEALIEALTKTAIWPYIETKGGLEAKVEDSRFSAGQLQLLLLARVVLRHGGAAGRGAVILLDEATSSVDCRTDDQVRDAISANLDGCTVIEVAHRLDIIRHYDVIVVMAEGRVVETGPPDELLAQSGSEFAALWASRRL